MISVRRYSKYKKNWVVQATEEEKNEAEYSSKVNNLCMHKNHTLPFICPDSTDKYEQRVASVAKHPKGGYMGKVNNIIDGITIYVYNRDKSILYFYTKNLYNFLVNLNINYHTYNKHLTNGTYYLRRYLFSKVFEPNAICKLITLLEFADILAKDKKKIKSRKIVE